MVEEFHEGVFGNFVCIMTEEGTICGESGTARSRSRAVFEQASDEYSA